MSDHYSSHGNDLLPNWLLPDVRKDRATHGDYLMFSSMATCDVADNRRRDAWRKLLAPCKKATKGWKSGVGTHRWCRSPMPDAICYFIAVHGARRAGYRLHGWCWLPHPMFR